MQVLGEGSFELPEVRASDLGDTHRIFTVCPVSFAASDAKRQAWRISFCSVGGLGVSHSLTAQRALKQKPARARAGKDFRTQRGPCSHMAPSSVYGKPLGCLRVYLHFWVGSWDI